MFSFCRMFVVLCVLCFLAASTKAQDCTCTECKLCVKPNRQVWSIDERGCPVCSCERNVCPVIKCPSSCRYGVQNFADLQSGCGKCRCRKTLCPLTKCPRTCVNGVEYYNNSRGCRTCRCEPVKTTASPGTGCVRDGNTYQVGETFKMDCNTCWCGPSGRLACTKVYCRPTTTPEPVTPVESPVKVCHVGGKTYQVGENFKVDCNTCSCRPSGFSVCTRIDCGSFGTPGPVLVTTKERHGNGKDWEEPLVDAYGLLTELL
ncbi:cysteine-rich motor neuron 1 protein-like isoform X9 [Littorina saxatilis]|uniref:cysteine-rich motor neuron 1 protein-like isoform X9 n=1 Tax=Littorina saxatilis TaxID=31220 RepID=UPI0038B4655F